MARKESAFWIILSGVLLLLGIVWVLFERNKRTATDQDGFAADTENLRSDWKNVGRSIQKGAEAHARTQAA